MRSKKTKKNYSLEMKKLSDGSNSAKDFMIIAVVLVISSSIQTLQTWIDTLLQEDPPNPIADIINSMGVVEIASFILIIWAISSWNNKKKKMRTLNLGQKSIQKKQVFSKIKKRKSFRN